VNGETSEANGSVIDSVVQPQKGERDLYHGAAEIADEDPLADAVSIGELSPQPICSASSTMIPSGPRT
jgi:predicted RNA-binding protein associated with RNAse of E/G family